MTSYESEKPKVIGRTVGALVIGQFLAILGLFTALSSEYQSNLYMRQWFSGNAWPMGYLLGNFLGSVLIGTLGTILIVWRPVLRQMQRRRHLD